MRNTGGAESPICSGMEGRRQVVSKQQDLLHIVTRCVRRPGLRDLFGVNPFLSLSGYLIGSKVAEGASWIGAIVDGLELP